jgi:hypothetical protein
MGIRTSAGTKLYVTASAPATYTDAGFTALVSFKEVGEIADLGAFGKKYNLATFNPLATRKTIKRKASYNNGTLALKLASSPTDEGQIVMQAGADSDLSYSFKVVTQSGSVYFFSGQIMGWMLEIGSVDQIMGASADVEIDNDIIASVVLG